MITRILCTISFLFLMGCGEDLDSLKKEVQENKKEILKRIETNQVFLKCKYFLGNHPEPAHSSPPVGPMCPAEGSGDAEETESVDGMEDIYSEIESLSDAEEVRVDRPPELKNRKNSSFILMCETIQSQ